MNIANGSMFTYGKFWPVLAKQYGIKYGIPEVDESKFQTIQMSIAPPPRGFGSAGRLRFGGLLRSGRRSPRLWWRGKRLRRDMGLLS